VFEASGGDYGWAFIIAAIMSAAGLVLVGVYMVLARRKTLQKADAAVSRGGRLDELETSEA
jgi:heme exporter protein D